MNVLKSHGCMCLTGPAIERIAADALSFLSNGPIYRDQRLSGGSGNPSSLAASFSASCSDQPPNCLLDPSGSVQQAAGEDSHYENGFRPHVTLVTKEEVALCTASRSNLLQEFQLLDLDAFFPAGIAITGKPRPAMGKSW